MPNHIHGIIVIDNSIFVGNGFKPFPTEQKKHGLSGMVRALKTFSSRRINESFNRLEFQWQKSFHDRIIRNEIEWEHIRHYIQTNPENWESDDLFLNL